MKENRKWACDPANLKSTDGMTIDPYGNIYVADFSANAIARITPRRPGDADGLLPDTDGFHGELDEPGEPCVWGTRSSSPASDLVTDEEKVNTATKCPPPWRAGRGALAKTKPAHPKPGRAGFLAHGEEALSGVNDNLAGLLLDDVVQALAVVLQRQLVGDQLLDLHRAALQILQRPAKAVGLGEGAGGWCTPG